MAIGRRARNRDFLESLDDMQRAQLNDALVDPDELQRDLDISIADRAAMMDPEQLAFGLRPIDPSRLLPAPVLR